MASNGGGPSRLQSARLVAAVAELTLAVIARHETLRGHFLRFAQRWSRRRHYPVSANTPRAREKPTSDWENGLKTCGAVRELRKKPTLVVGKKSNGKYRFKESGAMSLSTNPFST
jgi:hypothetical protein